MWRRLLCIPPTRALKHDRVDNARCTSPGCGTAGITRANGSWPKYIWHQFSPMARYPSDSVGKCRGGVAAIHQHGLPPWFERDPAGRTRAAGSLLYGQNKAWEGLLAEWAPFPKRDLTVFFTFNIFVGAISGFCGPSQCYDEPSKA